MKNIFKQLCMGVLTFATICSTLPMNLAYASEPQYYTDSKEKAGIVEKVMNDGSIDLTFNETFNYFNTDACFQPIACRPFRPQTKGKVETLAQTMNRLQVFNHEFTDLNDLEQVVKELNDDLNFEELSQGTFERPVDRWNERSIKSYL